MQLTIVLQLLTGKQVCGRLADLHTKISWLHIDIGHMLATETMSMGTSTLPVAGDHVSSRCLSVPHASLGIQPTRIRLNQRIS